MRTNTYVGPVAVESLSSLENIQASTLLKEMVREAESRGWQKEKMMHAICFCLVWDLYNAKRAYTRSELFGGLKTSTEFNPRHAKKLDDLLSSKHWQTTFLDMLVAHGLVGSVKGNKQISYQCDGDGRHLMALVIRDTLKDGGGRLLKYLVFPGSYPDVQFDREVVGLPLLSAEELAASEGEVEEQPPAPPDDGGDAIQPLNAPDPVYEALVQLYEHQKLLTGVVDKLTGGVAELASFNKTALFESHAVLMEIRDELKRLRNYDGSLSLLMGKIDLHLQEVRDVKAGEAQKDLVQLRVALREAQNQSTEFVEKAMTAAATAERIANDIRQVAGGTGGDGAAQGKAPGDVLPALPEKREGNGAHGGAPLETPRAQG